MEVSHSNEIKSSSSGGTFKQKRDLKRDLAMTKQECIRAMQKTASADGFITMTELCQFIGIKKPDHARKYVEGLPRLGGKRYFIPEVAERILSDMRYDNERV